MDTEITSMVRAFEEGRLTRRQLVTHLGAFMALAAAGARPSAAADARSTFEGTEINHIALRVPDVARSRDFYVKHLGLKVSRDATPANCFLECGERNFVALFRGNEPGMDHYCYSVEDYNVTRAEEKLKAEGFTPRVVRRDGRIYFSDPDGLTVQLASATHAP